MTILDKSRLRHLRSIKLVPEGDYVITPGGSIEGIRDKFPEFFIETRGEKFVPEWVGSTTLPNWHTETFAVHGIDNSIRLFINYNTRRDFAIDNLRLIMAHMLKIQASFSLVPAGVTVDVLIKACPQKKMMPKKGTEFGPNEINSGYSFSCGNPYKVGIYRREELERVLIHELIHCLCIDQWFVERINNPKKWIMNYADELGIRVWQEGNWIETYTEFITEVIFCRLFGVSEDEQVKFSECKRDMLVKLFEAGWTENTNVFYYFIAKMKLWYEARRV
jgi:hypothetical protein